MAVEKRGETGPAAEAGCRADSREKERIQDEINRY